MADIAYFLLSKGNRRNPPVFTLEKCCTTHHPITYRTTPPTIGGGRKEIGEPIGERLMSTLATVQKRED
jgi:hypothetical protein